MPNSTDILWFKLQFGDQIGNALVGTPFDTDMIVAIACKETGYIWQELRKHGLAIPKLLSLCVGDTLDANKGRSAFPKTKDDLVGAANGEAMFEIAHQALVDMAVFVPGYSGVAGMPNKFCHGYGVFQYDLQFFKTDPQFFLQSQYADLGPCLDRCLGELKRGLSKLGLEGRSSISDLEMAYVAITYNAGSFKAGKGLKQGHQDGDRFYGEDYYDYLLKCRSVRLPAAAQPRGEALTPAPTPVSPDGVTYEVTTRSGLLNLRKTPRIDPDNFQVGLPEGQRVRAVGAAVNGFLEVETNLAGAYFRGYASLKYLRKVAGSPAIPVIEVMATPAEGGPPAVYMPHQPGSVTRRTQLADGHSLNEPGAPGRKGTDAAKLTAELAAIIDWLAVDDPSHLRYQPRDGLTFCNIYAHDYCYLAGTYLPRVWWTQSAILAIGQGRTVAPKSGATIEEVRANGLFRWLRDFGPGFGWRQTGTLSKLQQHANQGGVGLIVARRNEEGRPGHIVAIAPETAANLATRDGAGEVVAPLQSQAGARNLRAAARKDWWTGAQFAEHAFWIHA